MLLWSSRLRTEADAKRSDPNRALKDIGTGELFVFEDGGKKITKTVLKKRGIEELNPDLIPVRKNPERERDAPERFDPAVIYKTSPLLAQLLTEGDAITTNAINRLAQVQKTTPTTTTRKSPRLAGDEPLEKNCERLSLSVSDTMPVPHSSRHELAWM